MKFRPVGDRVLVKVEDRGEEVTPAGVVIPEGFNVDGGGQRSSRCARGEVVAAGPGGVNESGCREEMPVAKGDRVLWPALYGHHIQLDGEEFVVLQAHEILAVL